MVSAQALTCGTCERSHQITSCVRADYCNPFTSALPTWECINLNPFNTLSLHCWILQSRTAACQFKVCHCVCQNQLPKPCERFSPTLTSGSLMVSLTPGMWQILALTIYNKCVKATQRKFTNNDSASRGLSHTFFHDLTKSRFVNSSVADDTGVASLPDELQCIPSYRFG